MRNVFWRVVHAGFSRVFFIPSATERLIHLAEYTYWNVSEIEVIPIDASLECGIAQVLPTTHNRFQMKKNLSVRPSICFSKEFSVGSQTFSGLGVGNFINEREEIAIIRLVKPT